jgi:hypothetical protein
MTNPITRLWRTNAPLTGVGLLMLGVLAASLLGLWIDPRTIVGAPAWLKPSKFAASIAIFTLTLAWVFTYLPDWPRLRRIVGWSNAAIFVIELAIIDLQAWRGVGSHFNSSTALDGVLFTIMGAGIGLQTMTSVAVAIALWRQTFTDRALGWALRLGMTISLVGAMTGGLMLRPTTEQLAQARVTHRMPTTGAHTVGAPDGGPGLPGTRWSREHGDLRVPHFLGLHALQAFALLVLALPRRWSEERRVRGMIAAASSYVALFAILLWQALRGESIVSPGAATLIALAAWAAMSAAGWIVAARSETMPAQAAAC